MQKIMQLRCNTMALHRVSHIICNVHQFSAFHTKIHVQNTYKQQPFAIRLKLKSCARYT